jgi:hypothetical protein
MYIHTYKLAHTQKYIHPKDQSYPGLCLFLFSIQLASLALASSLDIRRSNAPADDGQAENQVRAGPINPFVRVITTIFFIQP